MSGRLQDVRPFVYIATPYSNYSAGLEQALADACEAAAILMERGVRVFCPIAHSHSIAMQRGPEFNTHAVWLPADQVFIDLAGALVVVHLPGWDKSFGVHYEIDAFEKLNKPIFHMGWPELEFIK